MLSCLTHCDSTDCSLLISFVHGIFQARILEWVAVFSSKRSSQPRDLIHVFCVSCIGRQILYHCTTWEVQNAIIYCQKKKKKNHYKPSRESRTLIADISKDITNPKVCASSQISQSLICLFHGHLSWVLFFHNLSLKKKNWDIRNTSLKFFCFCFSHESFKSYIAINMVVKSVISEAPIPSDSLPPSFLHMSWHFRPGPAQCLKLNLTMGSSFCELWTLELPT